MNTRTALKTAWSLLKDLGQLIIALAVISAISYAIMTRPEWLIGAALVVWVIFTIRTRYLDIKREEEWNELHPGGDNEQ